MFEYSAWWNRLEKLRMYSHVGEIVSLGIGFELLKESYYSQCACLPPAWGSRCELAAVPLVMPVLCHHGPNPLKP